MKALIIHYKITHNKNYLLTYEALSDVEKFKMQTYKRIMFSISQIF